MTDLQTAFGSVISVTGSQSQVRFAADAAQARATVGKFLGIRGGRPDRRRRHHQDRDGRRLRHHAVAAVDMLGEIRQGERGTFFQRGVTEYPMIGDAVERRSPRTNCG